MAKLLAVSPAAVRVTNVVDKYAEFSGRRRLTQVTGVDVEFAVDVLDYRAATDVVWNINSFGSTMSTTLVSELRSSGLTDVTDVKLSRSAATRAIQSSFLSLPPSLLPPPPPKLVADYDSGASSTWRLSNALLLIIAAVVAT